ncbi:MAG: S46 family peptidase [Arenimonas sp.]
MRVLLGSSFLLLSFQLAAAEGMWMPDQLPEIAGPLKKAGLQLEVGQLADLTGQPVGAVISLGGCTASFVSPDGLVITNHHCATNQIQLNSTPTKNLLETGYNAATQADELSGGPNARVFVTEAITDVTSTVKAKLTPEMDGAARDKAIEAAGKALVGECEKTPGYRCSMSRFFGGLQYRLFKQREIKDVRLVYAPPRSVGNYGGEIDNWMWPRHTGDFTFFRAYVSPSGESVAFDKANVPYRPKEFLRIGSDGLKQGEFAMIAGYPGSTARYALAPEFANTASWSYPARVRNFKNVIALIEEAGKNNESVKIKYAPTLRGQLNTMKNYQGQLDTFNKTNSTAQKNREEAEVLAWLAKQGKKGETAVAAHKELVRLFEQRKKLQARNLSIGGMGGLYGTARSLYRLSIENEKPDGARIPGYQQRDMANFKGSIATFEKRFEVAMDRKILDYWLQQYIALPTAEHLPALDKWLGGNDQAAINRSLDNLYANTKLTDAAERSKWLDASRQQFENSDDAMIKLAVAMMPTLLELEENERHDAGDDVKYRPQYLQGVIDFNRSQGRAVYPDANGTLRITFGEVIGYSPQEGVSYSPFTSLNGVAAKATDSEPFDAPKNLLQAIKDKRYGKRSVAGLNSVPVNFMTDTDITGGNSGSPTLNSKGELVGLAFDGNIESVAANWLFDPALKRTIHVDIRYILWFMEQVEPAPRLLKEMNVEQ